jgi:hypothetical protein
MHHHAPNEGGIDAAPVGEPGVRRDSARLAGHDGELMRDERGWTWRGRLPFGALAPLVASASRGRSETLEGPAGAPSEVWLRALWFDAETGIVACELAATARGGGEAGS